LLVFGKLIALGGYFFFGSLQLKYIIITSNLLLVGTTYIIFRYLQQKKYPTYLIFPITLILFAPNINIDNFHLIGVTQHTGSIFFLTLIAYLTSKKTISRGLICLLIGYPFVSTEGWIMLPLIGIYMRLIKHPLKNIVAGLSLIAISSLVFLVTQQTPSTNKISIFDIIINSPLALLTFLGNAAWPISDSYKILINSSLGAFLTLLGLWSISKWNKNQTESVFPLLIWLQIIATGCMICIGRNQGNEISTLVLAERFFSYSNIFLAVTFLLLIPRFINFSKGFLIVSLFSLLYFMGSGYFFIPKQNRLKSQLRADLTNAITYSTLTNYRMESTKLKTFVNSPYFLVTKEELLEVNLPKHFALQKLDIEIDKIKDGDFQIKLKNIPNKSGFNELRWIILQSIQKPEIQHILPIQLDIPNRTKILEVNSMQLADLNHKNLWLYTIQADKTSKLAYLGSLK
jgi:hypothetical protein